MMRSSPELPTITASDLASRALSFARDLATRLDALNQAYPTAVLSAPDQAYLEHTCGSTVPGPVPQQYVPVFEELFIAYMASRYVIMPDA
jgi:hypothetical protein